MPGGGAVIIPPPGGGPPPPRMPPPPGGGPPPPGPPIIPPMPPAAASPWRSEEHTSELQSLRHLVCRLLLEKKNKNRLFLSRTLTRMVRDTSDVHGADL